MTKLEITIKDYKISMFVTIGDKLPGNANAELIRNINNVLERYVQK